MLRFNSIYVYTNFWKLLDDIVYFIRRFNQFKFISI